MAELTAAYNELLDQVIRQGVLHEDDHDHHSDEAVQIIDDGAVSDIVIAKATAMTVLFLAALCAGLMPFKLAQWFKWTSAGANNAKAGIVVSLLLAFGGGVLLCTTFLHLLPEVKENVQRLQASGDLPEFKFHFAELLMCLGFFTMYFIEQLVHAYLHKHNRDVKEAESAFQRGVSVRDSTIMSTPRRKKISENRNGSISIAELIANDVENDKFQVEIVPTQKDHHHQHGNHGHSHLHLPMHNNNNNNNHGDKANGIDDDIIVSSLRGLLIVLALSVHELFEGLAVGLEGSAQNVWYLFSAVAAHKLVLAFCVGVELIVAKTHRWLAFVYVLTFSIVSPIGIGIGILVSSGDVNSSTALVSAILQGLASGTLLYVVFFEILQKDKSGLLQLVATLIGFFIMFGLQFISKFFFVLNLSKFLKSQLYDSYTAHNIVCLTIST